MFAELVMCAVVVLVGAFLGFTMLRHFDGTQADPELAADVFVRVAHSLLLNPDPLLADEDRLRAFVRRHLLALVRA